MTLIEHELVCPDCRSALGAVYPPRCIACEWSGAVADLVISCWTRGRQFVRGKYPVPVEFR